MKRLFYMLLLAALVVCCKTNSKEAKDYVTLSGKITNKKADFLSIFSEDDYETPHKKIKINAGGTFKDTLKVTTGGYEISNGDQILSSNLFLKNGDDMHLVLNPESGMTACTGKGSLRNNYLRKFISSTHNLLSTSFISLEKSSFEKKVNEKLLAMQKSLDSAASKLNIDSYFINPQKERLKGLKEEVFKQYDKELFLANIIGKPSPKFVNYENYKGGKTSLDDFKGKYVYIDLWATWCGPCKYEIPFLEKVEKKYHGKNIAFISISIDKKEYYNAWRKMIADKKMKGIQLIADKNWDSKFVQGYKVDGIPRFILIDPKGNIIDSNAPRPSEKRLITLLDNQPL